MIEAKIEAKIIEELSAALERAEIGGVQMLGAWEVPEEGIKGEEKKSSRGYLSVKVSPRSFDTYTASEAKIPVQIELNIRAELDERGAGYLEVTKVIADYLQALQRSYDAGAAAFGSDDFIFSGFRLDGGDCGMDRERSLWTFVQSFTLQGVINN